MLVLIDPHDPQPIYEQIVTQIEHQIRSGQIAPAQRLPAATELAASLELNRNTVLQAYRLLRDRGLVELRRGRGAVALAPPKPAIDQEVQRSVQALIDVAQRHRLSLDAVTKLLSQGGLQ
ncbi:MULTISPECIES: GntR family transcriptional regulator [unclassified Corynebacterium]|uniref:GntR family transcriptional regulator n=1 Tax=unclassified Corynebacterium TaxID=2624378 RepID=UPI0029CA6622|nr:MULTISPECIES: GntR family transcriptional regulator [unclassified Corynebacterium]WPF65344.1 GntR family transcriptional regulator [Corynebacterium sp. 22KM0430]WPF67839.1 GntR family transcriptional regulator [Corynebacterium sp. 21KM1197]